MGNHLIGSLRTAQGTLFYFLAATILHMERLTRVENNEENKFIFPEHTYFMVHGGGKPQMVDGRMKLSPYSPPLSQDSATVLASGVRARAYALDTLYKLNPDNQWQIYTLGHSNNDDRENSSALALHDQLERFGISSHTVASPTDTLAEIIESTLIAAEALRAGSNIECVAHLSNDYHLPRIQLMDSLLYDPNGFEKLKMMAELSLEQYPEYQICFSDFLEQVVQPAVVEVQSSNIQKIAVSAEDVLRMRSTHWNTLIDSLQTWEISDGVHPWENRIRIEEQGLQDLQNGSYRFKPESLIEYILCRQLLLQ